LSGAGPPAGDFDPGRNCPLCPRLVAFRAANRQNEPRWHNAPVPAFGPLSARLLVVGLAPGLRGANRTGRPFTGDFAGKLLFDTLLRFGFAAGTYGGEADDGFTPIDCRVTNAVRCVPPQNKPTAGEIKTCRRFLAAELARLGRLEAILALGRVAHDQTLAALGERQARWRFRHGARHKLPGGVLLADSYHCSRYNTNTGRLTPAMFEEVVAQLRKRLRGPG